MNLDSKTILIVDDESDILEMYKDFIESEGFNVLTASSAEEALSILENKIEKIGLIISDSNMKKKSGLELLRDIKIKYQSIPFFYLATGEVNQSEQELKLLGVNRLLIKPFELDEIVAKIKIDLKL